MPQSFEIGDEALAALRAMWPVLGVSSNAEALRLAIALAAAVTPYADPEGRVWIDPPEQEHDVRPLVSVALRPAP